MANQSQTRVDFSATALGLAYRQWTRQHLTVILSHYGVHIAAKDSKNTLINSLNQLAAQHGLTSEDRLTIIKARETGIRLPPRKPIIGASAPQSATAQPAPNLTQPTRVQVEQNSSDASDGSDVDVSDSEDTDEIPSLSDEERDLREYTATMNMHQSSGTRRILKPRSPPSKSVDRLLSMNRPMIKRRPAVIENKTSARRANPAASNQVEATSRFKSNQLLRTPAKKAAPSAQLRNGPSISQDAKAAEHDCIICYDSFDPIKSHMRQPTPSCVHEVNVCRSCLSTSISSQSKAKLWTRISCPSFSCNGLLGYNDIQEFAEPQIFAR